MDVFMIDVGDPEREHEIERPGYPTEEPVTRPVELPDPVKTPVPEPAKTPA